MLGVSKKWASVYVPSHCGAGTQASWSFDVPEIGLEAGIIRIIESERERAFAIKACALPPVMETLDEGCAEGV